MNPVIALRSQSALDLADYGAVVDGGNITFDLPRDDKLTTTVRLLLSVINLNTAQGIFLNCLRL